MTGPDGRGTRLRAARYLRVSTKEQIVDSQELDTNDLIQRRGYELVATYLDKGQSGGKSSRPALDQMMEDARRRKFDVLIVWRSDRLFRSLKHFVLCMADLAALGIKFLSVREPFDTTTPSGVLLLQICASMAEFEKALVGERTKAGMKAAVKRGAKIGRPRKRIDMGEVNRLRMEGKSVRSIAKILDCGATTIHRAIEEEDSGDTLHLPAMGGISD